MKHHFFAYVSRLRYIRRWGLMRSVMPENDAEHALQVAMIAHAIAIIGRDHYGRQVNPEHVLALGVYHDVSEVITGDMPTPVKYQTDELRKSYKDVERMANERLLSMLPEGLRPAYEPYLSAPQDYDRQILKAADSISAYLKCMEEKRAGNREFDAAGESIKAALDQIELPEVQDFIREFIPSFELSLDELNQPVGQPPRAARD
ncbi:MAG: 5'-deoxynucleotidase [Clostridia bacterium]|nr:5'-deoxynucleotidase [Clostridia bacterium]